MMQLEAACANKCEELVAATKSELDSIRKECDKKQSDLLSAQAELSITTQLKSQVCFTFNCYFYILNGSPINLFVGFAY